MTFGTARGRQALSFSIAFTILATLFTIIRIYTRAFLVKQMGADDWAILVALALSWAFFGLFVGEVKYLMGEHFADIPTEIFVKQMKCFWVSIPIYQLSLVTTKASLLLQIKRVFSTPRMCFACWCMIGFLAVYGAWVFISAWLTCIPVAKFWYPEIDGYCLNKKALWFSNSGFHIFTDILILILPMPVLHNLQLPRRQKLALMGIFALGAFVLVTSILRLQSLLDISNSSDPTYDNAGAATWSAIECNVAIICACLPGIRAFLSKLLPRFLSSYKSKSNTYSKTPRSRNLRHSNYQYQSSVTATAPPFPMKPLSNLQPSDSQPSSKEAMNKIKVTTTVSQESVSHMPEDASSVRELL
ncbi:putative integral membrane protein [Aspergillus clavatus NRRL 1]|uniref:Integral membrane protein, putative n=1 Tax=Aspergillus clavatus (strain ATCC 1007 / CBS 513.65 / DSM 816 / NCTC 3887 / NRRL 1 / QM 1276 / 107) TaxID=344612 RepID=A1CTG4_ASPCL|nr:integral membrane protein, putative [Aspergillus clavatus NRRL 1]EAW06601.1 integral membrane protein, putative [Aspergillus clavatus NRRL 1]